MSENNTPLTNKQFVLQFVEGSNPEHKCSGCRYCEIICSLVHTGVVNPMRSRIRVQRGEPAIDKPVFCRQCQEPKCLKSCPTGAIYRNQIDGVTLVDEEKCTGCAKCVDACPFRAVFIDPLKNVALMCDLCGSDPACVKYCSARVLKLVAREPTVSSTSEQNLDRR